MPVPITSDPVAASGSAGHLDVFARGADNALWHQEYDGTWHPWESLGGTLASAPVAVSWAIESALGRVDVFAQDPSNVLLHLYKWVGINWGKEAIPLPWPLTLDAQALLASGWNPVPFREFIVKIHSRCDLSCDYCYMYEMADQSWRDRPRRMSAEIAGHAAGYNQL